MNEPIRDTAHSLLNVARSAVDLAKAELQLATLEAKGALSKFTTAMALGYLAVLFGQVALLLLALTPILLAILPWPRVVASLAIPTLGTIISGVSARHAFQKQRRSPVERVPPTTSEVPAPRRSSVPPSPDQIQR